MCVSCSLHPCILAGLTTCVRRIYPLSSSRPSVLLPPSSFLLHITPSETNIFLSCVSKLSFARSLTGSFLLSCGLWSLRKLVFNFASLDLDRHSAISATFTYLTSKLQPVGLQDLDNKSQNKKVTYWGVLPSIGCSQAQMWLFAAWFVVKKNNWGRREIQLRTGGLPFSVEVCNSWLCSCR